MKIPASLTYSPDTGPGIRRRRYGRGFGYVAPDGSAISDKAERARLNALGIPPAWEDVWISPEPDGHLQATGRDARGRKQYRYHPDWTAWRDRAKYDRLADFGEMLPRIRRRILSDLKEDTGDRVCAVASVLALIDRLSMRVGHPAYSRENNSFGATTLRRRHLELDGDTMILRYRAKGGKKVVRRVRDSTLNRTLTRHGDLPGPALVSWLSDEGEAHRVTSDEVNATIAEITGDSRMTARTFRTWNGSAAALEAALSLEKPTIRAMSDAAAERLHNTHTIARNSYIHPDVIALTDAASDLRERLAHEAPEKTGLRRAEEQLLHLLGGTF
ncbi:DNA topoisomerase IB [Roseobacter ponti]|uniref:DNA topoisomerase n=1 Tax=Roseobacter ponti TaxID=1891787 RepID=A0A858SY52_9RHOB|nr:DNA topoisomerase IB [Roseobacter ponti]QJF52928.1 DNA topoisomerase IB [Roseobacter ponti]